MTPLWAEEGRRSLAHPRPDETTRERRREKISTVERSPIKRNRGCAIFADISLRHELHRLGPLEIHRLLMMAAQAWTMAEVDELIQPRFKKIRLTVLR